MKDRLYTLFAVFLLFLSCGVGLCEGLTTDELWQMAMTDAVFADEDEIRPLVELTPESQQTVWNDAGDRVLLVSWHAEPDRYLQGERIVLDESDLWTFTSKEMETWYCAHAKEGTDWTLRLEQLIGLPENAGYTHFTAFWTRPEDVIRPAYVTDVTAQMSNDFIEQYDAEYMDWFNENILWSYFEEEYPWTRLGYTYDWAADSDEYGVSEFLLLAGSEVEIAFTCTTEAFLARLASGNLLNDLPKNP